MDSNLSTPNIRNIHFIDLKRPERLEVLYRQFVLAGKLDTSEASALNFAAAAVRAGSLKELAEDRRVKIFLGIVRRRLWSNISQHDEDHARRVIVRRREIDPRFMLAA